MREDDGRNYVQPVTGALGAEIHGVDLAETFNNETFSEIYDAFLDLLYDHTENPDFSCRFRWRASSIAMWDNRRAQHRVSADYFNSERDFRPGRRHLHMVTMIGDRPF